MTSTPPTAPRAVSTGIELRPGIPICQGDLPLDWYQEELKPYAEEYLALPDRTPETVLPWLDGYVRPALEHFGEALGLLAHYYMGGEIVKLVERYGGTVADSYTLALEALRHPEKKVVVESAVHFMAESVAILAGADQAVWITNPKAGCTMEMMARDWMVMPVLDQLLERYGEDLVVIAYMNTSGRLKAIAGRTGGAVCTSSNANAVVGWARQLGKRILFLPDQHLGRNVADGLGMDPSALLVLPNPQVHAGNYGLDDGTIEGGVEALDAAEMILWGSYCGVHTVFTVNMVEYWKARGWTVLVHPESPCEVVRGADGAGSTAYLWQRVGEAPAGSRIAIGTEGHFVRNARLAAAERGVQVVHLAEVPEAGMGIAGCACATMSRNDPPHLAGVLDLLRRGRAPDLNRVLPGDGVDEHSGVRDRLGEAERAELVRDARTALERMIAITEGR